MKKEEINIYREIQKNVEMAITAIETISDKVYDDSLSRQMSRESLKYYDIRNRAIDKLLLGKTEICKTRPINEFMIKSAVQMNTILNTSTSHIAELMIRGSNRGIVDMWKMLNMYPEIKGQAVEMAKELVYFEEKNIERLKKYL